jgi:hypothetical protein
MNHYDPDIAPIGSEWLALDEQARIDLVLSYHRINKVKLPNLRAHAAIHAIVENQIVEGFEVLGRTVDRLRLEGLSRHDAIHAIGSVLAGQLLDLAKQADADDPQAAQQRYHDALLRLTAKQWLQGKAPT